jgi:hypothetical protein
LEFSFTDLTDDATLELVRPRRVSTIVGPLWCGHGWHLLRRVGSFLLSAVFTALEGAKLAKDVCSIGL